MSGRSFVYESVQGRPETGYGYGTVPVRESRLPNKFREVPFHSNAPIGVSTVSSKYSWYDFAPARLQSRSN